MIYAATTRVAEAALRLRAQLGGSEALQERLVIGPPPARAAIWVHGASVGELTSARSVIEALASTHDVIVSANSETGRDMVRGWGLCARLAPLDMPGALARFLDAVQPGLQLTIENEFWPLRSRMLADRGITQAMIGARMSDRSAGLWARLPRVIGPMLGRITALSAQDAQSEGRLRDLGLAEAAVLPRLDLKLLAPARIDPPPDSPSRDLTVLAASTHDGEDAIIIDAWMAARARHPDLRLVLAIRHPDRGDDVAALIAARGLPVARRSRGDEAGDVLLVDVLGEMTRWYAGAGTCLVGGSWTDRGGHTPWEPAAHRCAILYGPFVSNFAEPYRILDQAGAARRLTADDLAAALTQLAGDPQAARDMGRRARTVLQQRAGDPATLVSRLRDLANSHGHSDIRDDTTEVSS